MARTIFYFMLCVSTEFANFYFSFTPPTKHEILDYLSSEMLAVLLISTEPYTHK